MSEEGSLDNAVDESSFHKFTTDDEWIEVISSPADSTAWQPPKNDGATLFVQTEQGKYLKYVFENGRYNLVGEVDG